MKKFFSLTALIATTFILSAQETEPNATSNTKSKLSIGFLISPNVAYRTLSEKDYPYPQVVKLVNEIEAPKLGYTAGVILAFTFHEKIQMLTGLTFSNNGYRIKKQEPLRFGNQFNGYGFNDTLPGEPSGINAIAFVKNFYYLDLPLQVKYTFLKKKIELYVLGGVEINIRVTDRNIAISWYDDGSKERDKYSVQRHSRESRNVNLSAVAGMGMEINLSRIVSLFVQPTFRYMIVPGLDRYLKKGFYSGGLATGFMFDL